MEYYKEVTPGSVLKFKRDGDLFWESYKESIVEELLDLNDELRGIAGTIYGLEEMKRCNEISQRIQEIRKKLYEETI